MSLWKRLWVGLVRLGIAGIVIAFIAGIFAAAYFAAVFPDWTGFAADPIPSTAAVTPIVVYQPAKTLWDWLQLLLVPLVIAVGGYALTRSENRYALQLQERREAEAQKLEDQRIKEARKLEEQRTEEARKIEEQRAQDTALQAYLDQMTQLLLHEYLRTSQPDNEVRSVARARTLAVLRVLDGARKATVLQFLYEAKLIGGIKIEDLKGSSGSLDKCGSFDPILFLDGADLRGADLTRAQLDRAHLQGVHLDGARLQRADLGGTNLLLASLCEADLTGATLQKARLGFAKLQGANLQGAHLYRANFSEANLDGANLAGVSLVDHNLRWTSLKGTNLDGANLTNAHLNEANLHGAKLVGAILAGADLTNCKVTREQLAQAASLEGAILPFDMTSPPVPEVKGAAQEDQVKRNV